MDGLRNVVPGTVPLTLNGVTYEIPVWNFEDFTRVERKIAESRLSLREKTEALANLAPEVQRAMFKEMVENHERDSRVSHDEVFEYMTGSFDGLAFALYAAFDRQNPGVFEFEDFRKVLVDEGQSNPESLDHFIFEMRAYAGMPNPTHAADSNPATPSQTNGKQATKSQRARRKRQRQRQKTRRQ